MVYPRKDQGNARCASQTNTARCRLLYIMIRSQQLVITACMSGCVQNRHKLPENVWNRLEYTHREARVCVQIYEPDRRTHCVYFSRTSSFNSAMSSRSLKIFRYYVALAYVYASTKTVVTVVCYTFSASTACMHACMRRRM